MMVRFLGVAVALASGCDAGCEEDQYLTAAGECVDGAIDGPVWLDDVVEGAQVRPCELAAPGSALDLRGGCADDVCRDDTWEMFTTTLGNTASCAAFGIDQRVACRWPSGVGAHFDDLDRDEVPDAGSIGSVLTVETPWPGSNEDGLALGISMGCFVEVLGEPEDIDLEAYGNDAWLAVGLEFEIPGVADIKVYDRDSQDSFDPDGYADHILIFGPAR